MRAVIAGGGLPHGIDWYPDAARRGIHAHAIFGDPSGPNDVTRRVPSATRTDPPRCQRSKTFQRPGFARLYASTRTWPNSRHSRTLLAIYTDFARASTDLMIVRDEIQSWIHAQAEAGTTT